jgi:hypothetical protein
MASLPNPTTPLAFLPPTIAEQFQVAVYLAVASMAAFIWDWLTAIPDEIKLLRGRRLDPPVVVYFLSRIGTLADCTAAVVLLAAPVASCEALKNVVGASFIISVTSTSGLFFFRVKAVYCDNPFITSFFGFLVFALFGLSFLTPVALKGQHLGSTQRCVSTGVARYASTPVILNAAIDTLVFFAISMRIVSYSITGDTFGAKLRSFLKGEGLPSLSRSLLRGGQMYYCATIGLSVSVAILVLTPVPVVFRTMFIVPNLALASAMACRVFRGIRLGSIEDMDLCTIGSTTKRSTLRFVSDSNRTMHLSQGHGNPVVMTEQSSGCPLNVKVQTLEGTRYAVEVVDESRREQTMSDGKPDVSPV